MNISAAVLAMTGKKPALGAAQLPKESFTAANK